MLRVKSNSLSEKSFKMFYDNMLFTGISYTLIDGIQADASEYFEGKKLKSYFNPIFTPHNSIIDFELLEAENEDDYESFQCYLGKRFTGIALEFEDNICIGEFNYIRGWLYSQETFYKSGIVSSVELIEDDLSQKYHWYENNQISNYEIFQPDHFSIRLAFTKTGEITILHINGTYFENILNLSNKVIYPLFIEKNSITTLLPSSFLSISGSAVNDKLFITFCENNPLSLIQKLIIRNTAITFKSIPSIELCENIIKLAITSKSVEIKDIQNFKLQNPKCQVELNGKELIA